MLLSAPHFELFQIFVPSFPSFGRAFDSHAWSMSPQEMRYSG